MKKNKKKNESVFLSFESINKKEKDTLSEDESRTSARFACGTEVELSQGNGCLYLSFDCLVDEIESMNKVFSILSSNLNGSESEANVVEIGKLNLSTTFGQEFLYLFDFPQTKSISSSSSKAIALSLLSELVNIVGLLTEEISLLSSSRSSCRANVGVIESVGQS